MVIYLKKETKSMTNPEIVVDTIIDSEGTKTENNIKIYPCTIRRYALLEKLESPFISPDKKFDVTSIVPSAYIFASDNSKLKMYTTKDIEILVNDAFDWAESLKITDIPQMIEIITKQITDINKAAPTVKGDGEVSEEGSKKK